MRFVDSGLLIHAMKLDGVRKGVESEVGLAEPESG